MKRAQAVISDAMVLAFARAYADLHPAMSDDIIRTRLFQRPFEMEALRAAISASLAANEPASSPPQTLVETERDAALRKAKALWQLLDNIDTLDDACLNDDRGFRNLVRTQQQRRFDVMSGEEFTAIVGCADQPQGDAKP